MMLNKPVEAARSSFSRSAVVLSRWFASRTIASSSPALRVALVVVLVASLFGLATSCAENPDTGPGASSGVLSGLVPIHSSGISRAPRLNDGIAVGRGAGWKSDATCVFTSGSSFVEFDLGASKTLRAGWLQGDNNDTYTVSVSDDAQTWKTLWNAAPVSEAGMQERSSDTLEGSGRYVRITASGGDGKFALSEIQLFEARPSVFPPKVPAREGKAIDETVRTRILMLAVAFAFFVFATWKTAKPNWKIAAAVVPLIAAYALWKSFAADWPPGAREVSLVRACTAAVGLFTVLRVALAPRKWAADSWAVLSTLAVCGVFAVLSFFNLGHPQFVDHHTNGSRFIHDFDMRMYYPPAKYWKELHYDGVYLASAQAYTEIENKPVESLARTPMRSMTTHRMTTFGEAAEDMRAVKARFSEQRWQAFLEDMRYFRRKMGQNDYLSTLTDHGANATPVWMTVAHGLFRWTPVSDGVLMFGALLDPLLLILTFLVIGRTFGLPAMFLTMIVFGANDFYMFGSNWAGATLRHDWMAYLGLGICALAKQRWKAAGALLMLSAMIRAFPVMALVGASIPAIAWLVNYYSVHKKLPTFQQLKKEQGPIVEVAYGALICGLVAFAVSSAVLGFSAWPEWYHKVTLLESGAAVNQVSWRGLIAGPESMHDRVFKARIGIYWAGIVAFGALAFYAARNRKLYQGALFGIMLVPIVMNPANYYSHMIFLLPLLAVGLRSKEEPLGSFPRDTVHAGIWVAMLLLCAAQYGTVLEKDLGTHFYLATALLFVTFSGIFGLIVGGDLRRMDTEDALALAGVPSPAPTPDKPVTDSPSADSPSADSTSAERGNDTPPS